MKKILLSSVLASSLLLVPSLALAVGVSTNFEPTTYLVGNIDGQDGWVKTGTFDAAVFATGGTPISFGTQSFRISDAVTSGSFGDQTFSKALVNEAGETDALNASMSGGVRQPHFEAQFDLASVLPNIQQSGMHVSVSPDRGDGARMSYLRFEDQAGGIHVFFDDVTDPSNAMNMDTFNETDIATLDRSVPHTIKFSMDFIDGPDNDVVKIYIDGILKITGTSWEDYYRFDTESNPSLAQNKSRTVDSLLFRESGTANPNDVGKGFLIDNLSLLSGPIPQPIPTSTVVMCKVDSAQHPLSGWTLLLRGAEVQMGLSVPTNVSSGVDSTPLDAGTSYIAKASGTWLNQGSANPVDAEYSTTDGWVTHMDGYTGYQTDILELQINSLFDPASIWGPYNSAHTYAQSFVPSTNGPANFRIFDGTGTTQNEGWFGDNSGSLNVDIYKGFAGVTGEDGCVTFTNVPYGEYTADEISQDNWVNVSGTGAVTVNSPEQTITITNRDTTLPTTGTISGMKYNDVNRNGKMDAGEIGLAGWTINLETITGTVIAQTVTDTNGNYTFTNVAPGTYKLREVHQSGWKRMSKNPKPIVIIAGSVVTGVSFGNSKKHKEEKEDSNKDDQRDDQSGYYYAHHGRSNYTRELDNKNHQQNNQIIQS